MKNGPVKRSISQPARLPYIKAVVAVSKVVIDAIALSNLEYMQDKDVHYKLGQYDDCGKRHIVLDVILADPVVHGNLRFIGKGHDEEKSEGDK